MPRIFCAPGRVNLIGEHTDYNDGFVMPAAIEFYSWVAVAPRADRIVRLQSEEFRDQAEFSLDDASARKRNHWSDYVQGVAIALQSGGYRLQGAEMLIHSEVPIGAGLSSSAALEVSSGMALLENVGYGMKGILELTKLALMCQRAENEFVGARSGIMDQFISCHGREGHALMLDCRSLQFTEVPTPDSATIVICNTMVKHSIASGEYNTRRAECEKAVKQLASKILGLRSLRDLTLEQLDAHRELISEVLYRRAHHVVTENLRVQEAAAALEKGDLGEFGKLMRESHVSLRDDYEVSSKELDAMVEIALQQPGVFGARMTGGGFGGCTVNLVESAAVAGFRSAVARGYRQRTGIEPQLYVSEPSDGVHEVTEVAEVATANYSAAPRIEVQSSTKGDSLRVLVTGGAGYIGSVVSAELLAAGHSVVVYDNLSHGHASAIPDGADFVEGDIAEAEKVGRLLRERSIDAVMHFAAFIEAGESMKVPEKYFQNNSANALVLLQAVLGAGVKKFVFSSTAALYGDPQSIPIKEDDPLIPTNAYGESKLLVERMLLWFNRIHGLKYASLRYFNAAGAAGCLGEAHQPESHLIPLVLQVARGVRESIAIYGTDYPTHDGTCVRDYIHVSDLAQAHVLALQGLETRDKLICNLGNGRGFSVREVIEVARKVTNHAIPAVEAPRRPGDPAVLVASSERIMKELGWKPRYPELETIIRSAWEWHQQHPHGYLVQAA
ncbi:MAG: UDP-galactose 4-epimerase [Acidobacteriales bacterium]|nr:UDP-galactose 4-epimerase [Terriglobales bacterium]